LVVACLVVLSSVLRFLAARRIATPWIAPDEMVYALLGRSLWAHGSLSILGGPTPFYSFVYPAFVGVPLSIGSMQAGYTALKAVQALTMSLAAVPVYLWGRSLMRPWWAVVAAGLTLAIPGLAYSGLVMSEVVFYPLLVVAAWAAARALAEPTPRRQAVFIAVALVLVATRLQALVLVFAVPTAAVVEALLARQLRRLTRLWPLAAASAVGAGFLLVRGSAGLGGYAAAAGHYDAGEAAKYVAYHGAALLLLCGVLPVCALAIQLVAAARWVEAAQVRAFLAVTASLAVWSVVEVGVFASEHAGRIEERDLLGLAPLLFLGFALWLDRGAPRTYLIAATTALAAAGLLMALPYKRFVTPAAAPDSFTFAATLRVLQTHPSLDPLVLIGLPAAVLATLSALLPRRLLAATAPLLIVALIAASVGASQEVRREAAQRRQLLVGSDPSWIDHALAAHRTSAPVAFVYTGNPDFTAAWAAAFWNRDLSRIYRPPQLPVGGPLVQHILRVGDDGVLRSDRHPLPDRYLVVSSSGNLPPVGDQVATTELTNGAGATQTLGLWQVKRPARVLMQKLGFQPNGDIYHTGIVRVYNCARGSFTATLLGKTTERIVLALNGTTVRTISLRPGQAKTEIIQGHPEPGSSRRCTLTITPTSTLGTTQLLFAPG
jgi:hypothetical protein